MEQDTLGSGTNGGAAGTGAPEAVPEGRGSAATGQEQGDDLANRLGGQNAHAGTSGSTGSGDLDAGRSTSPPTGSGLGSPGAGDIGGMGGPGQHSVAGRPHGGVSPIQNDPAEQDSEAHPS